jgi:hypothetical protein
MWVPRILALLVVVAGGWWLWQSDWHYAPERPLLYEKGTYLGPMPDARSTDEDELRQRALRQTAF